jgi:uncharacterized protein (TIGR00369 family)
MNEKFETADVSRQRLDDIIAVSFFKTVLGGEIREFGAGRCELFMPVKPEFRQFLGAVHGGIVGALADDACAWACASVAGGLVTVSYTINLLAAASGDGLIARGQLVKAGRRIIVGRADVLSVTGRAETLVAMFQATMSPV